MTNQTIFCDKIISFRKFYEEMDININNTIDNIIDEIRIMWYMNSHQEKSYNVNNRVIKVDTFRGIYHNIVIRYDFDGYGMSFIVDKTDLNLNLLIDNIRPFLFNLCLVYYYKELHLKYLEIRKFFIDNGMDYIELDDSWLDFYGSIIEFKKDLK